MSYSATTTWTATHGNLLLAVTVEPAEVGRRLKAAREKRGLTQLQFALEANVSPSSVARWEAGKLPPIRELMRLAELLKIDSGELVESPQQNGLDERAAILRELAEIRRQLGDGKAQDRRMARLEKKVDQLLARQEPPRRRSTSADS